ncbi:unnamed protein product [Hymenolepis diminuta]|uniref:Protein odr-4 homolog n=1 Tax=Hymenolepis diminuta TaxID=6216 RepID=A0A564YJ44_HYMDI|nr:unnamed protein product [Hymenolepis diminuta]
MIKTLSIEQKFYDRCLSQKPTGHGLIISGSAKEDECVFLLLISTAKDYTDLNTINTLDLRHECQKVCRMLPAGSRVSGVYYCGPLNLSKSGAKVKEILYTLHQGEKNPMVDKFVPLTDRDKVFLHVDPFTKVLTAKAIGFDHPKDFLRPIDVKVRPVMDRWRAIKTHINLILDTYLPAERQKETIFAELQEAVSPFLETITSKTRILLNGDLKEDSDPVFSKNAAEKPARHSKRRQEVRGVESPFTDNLSSSWDSTNFTLFSSDFPSWRRTNSSSSIDSGHVSDAFATPVETTPSRPEGYKNLAIHGRIPGLAFLPIDGTTVKDALKAFRRDLVQSILQRLELLTEELQISGGEVDCARILLPSRVLIRIPACPACPLSDYKFISETPDDVIRRVALFFRPLGSATPPALLRANTPSGHNSPLGTPADSGECSSDSEFNAEDECEDKDIEEEVAKMTMDGDNVEDVEPVFDAACLDTQLERTFDSVSVEEEISQLELLTDIQEMAQTVKQSRGKILLVGSAFAVVILSIFIAIYMELLPL